MSEINIIELAILFLIKNEDELEDKLDLLTSIGITARNPETFAICEKIRDQIVSDSNSTLPSKRPIVLPSEPHESNYRDSGLSKFSDFYGEE